MSHQVRFTTQAWDDLRAIIDYIAHDNPIAADSFATRLNQQCKKLARAPGIGRKRDDLVSGMRSFPFGSYVLFYQEQQDELLILRVLHGARDCDAEFQ